MSQSAGCEGRLRSPDVFKGLAIFFIAILHLAIVARSGMSEPSPLIQALYLGLVGFFVLSGYFFRPGRGFVGNMRSRVRILFLALVIAAAALPVISFLWCSLWGQPTGFGDLVDCWKRTFGLELSFVTFGDKVPWAICGFSMGYYYLWCMLGAFIIFYAVADRIRDRPVLGTLTVLVLVSITAAYRELFDFTLPFYLNLSPIAAAFMICGMYIAKLDLVGRVESCDLRDVRWWAPFVICTAVLLVMVFLLPPTITFDHMSFGKHGGFSAFPYMVEGVLAFVMILYLSFFISRIPLLSSTFVELGKHTLGILLLHVFVAKMILAPFFTFNSVDCVTADLAGIGRTVFAFVALFVTYLICAYGPKLIGLIMERSEVPERSRSVRPGI